MADLTTDLIGYWPLTDDVSDHSPLCHPTQANAVEIASAGPNSALPGAGRFNGYNSVLEVADHPAFHVGAGELTLAAWLHSEDSSPDVVGSLISKFDPSARRGFELLVLSQSGVTSGGQPNYRQLQLGIDSGDALAPWQDCDRPGHAAWITAMTAFEQRLYVASFERGSDQCGRVFRYEAPRQWVDLGNPSGSNAVRALAEHTGKLFCGTSRFFSDDPGLSPPGNRTPGGRVYCLASDGEWAYCGHPGHEDAVPEMVHVHSTFEPGKADDVVALTTYRGDLFCVSSHRRGVFRYAGGQRWHCIGPDQRVNTLVVYRGRLFALANGGPIYCYESGTEWTDVGFPKGATQCSSAVVYGGRLLVGAWPAGTLFRYEGQQHWQEISPALSDGERQFLGMAVYNGKLYLGTLPHGNVYRLDDGELTLVGNLESGPGPMRRVWTMCVCHGRLFAGGTPGGKVWGTQAGIMATADRTLSGGWRHVAAVKEARRLKLYVDGALVGWSERFEPQRWDLSNRQPLRIGFGAFAHLCGSLCDVRFYRRALDAGAIRQLLGAGAA